MTAASAGAGATGITGGAAGDSENGDEWANGADKRLFQERFFEGNGASVSQL
jgi:hypothetical protein